MSKQIMSMLLAVTICIAVVAPTAAQPTPFMISGYVFYENGTACNNPTVNITNTNTSEDWNADTNATSNYYKLILANGTHVNATEILRFNATSTDGSQSKVFNHTVTSEEINSGGLFDFNITFGAPAAPGVVINEFVSKPSAPAKEWIELYNPTDSDVSLDGWTLEDGAGNSLGELSGKTVPANGYLVFNVSDKLNDAGDIIYLNLSTSTTIVDKVAYGNWDDGNPADNAPAPGDDESAGRCPNGVDTDNDRTDFRIFDIPTRGASNTGFCVASDGTAFGCGDTVTKDCWFNGSMCCEGDGLILGPGQPDIYGNGYAIIGNGTGTGIKSPGSALLSINDLEIENFEKGIWLQDGGFDYKVVGCKIHNNSLTGIHLDHLDQRRCIVSDCEIYNNGDESGGAGIHIDNIHLSGSNAEFEMRNNDVHDNAVGIYCEGAGKSEDIEYAVGYNFVKRNYNTGIAIKGDNWTVKNNLVKDSSEAGIYVQGNETILSSNTVVSNKYGIHIAEGSDNVTLMVNTVCSNTERDIYVDSPDNISGDENACETTHNYNDTGTTGCTYPCVGCISGSGIIYRCGSTVTESCTFNGDITCPVGDGLIIGASGTAEEPIVIDGNGYCLDGVSPGTSMRSGIYNPGYDYITIKDLEIKHFHHGINLGGSPESPGTVEHNVIVNCSVHDNGDPDGFATHGIATYHAWNCSITNCEIYNNTGFGVGSCEDGGRGILLYGPGGHNTVTHNRVYNNGMVGIYSKMKNKYNYIAYNDVYGNGKQLPPEGTFMPGGISLACIKTDFWVVEHNNISDNAGSGISVGGSNNVFRYNNVTNTSIATGGRGNGICIGRCSRNNTLFSNVFCDNEGEDIYVQDCCSDVTGDENTCDTSSNYNDEGTTGCTYFCGGTTVIADFSAEPTKGAEPLKVNFTDESRIAEGEIVSWKWDFGDGNTSTEQNATHTYSTAEPYSYYNVSLNVTTSEGDSDVEMKTEYIKVWKPDAAPDADFSASPRKMQMSPLTVDFTDLSLGEVESWFWDFGDGATSNEQNPTHTYGEGIYTVSLTVTGPGGSAKDTKTNYIVVNRPDPVPAQTDAHFFADKRSGAPPLEVKFTDMSRSAGEIDSWLWDFGDGNTSTEQNPTHTYSTEGTYTVSLEVTAGDAKATEVKADYISVKAGTCGDVNEDGDVNMLDVIDVLYYVSYPGEYTIGSAWAADVNCDTRIDMLDVIDLLYYVSYPGEYELECCES